MGRGVDADWLVAHACVRGRGHVAERTPCQDAAAVARNEESLAVCVCDGAGSASLSHLGAAAVSRGMAQLFCSESRALLRGNLTAGDLLREAQSLLGEARRERGGSVEEYACTLLGLVIAGNRAVGVHLGDGVIASVVEGCPATLSAPDNGEFANETTFVTSRDALEHLRVTEVGIGPLHTSFALFTDGAETKLFSKMSGRVSQVVEQLASWLDVGSGEEVCGALENMIKEDVQPKTEDDCTIALLRKRETFAFACPVCLRWDLARVEDSSWFSLRCGFCSHSFRLALLKTGRVPPVVGQWARHLVEERGMSLSRASVVSRVSRKSIRRWLRGRRGRTR